MTLSEKQIDRYSRQVLVPQIGGRGQARLLAAQVLVCGNSLALNTALEYVRGAGVTVAKTDSARPDVILMDSATTKLNHRLGIELPAIVFGAQKESNWYLRMTNCPQCIGENSRRVTADDSDREGDPATASARAATLGAAAALDTLKYILGLTPLNPAVVVLANGSQSVNALPPCPHRSTLDTCAGS